MKSHQPAEAISPAQAAAQYPKVGVGVMILKDGKVLLGKRKNAHGEGQYANTGGHVEPMESLVDTAKRETMEEAGIVITNVHFLCQQYERLCTEALHRHWHDRRLAKRRATSP